MYNGCRVALEHCMGNADPERKGSSLEGRGNSQYTQEGLEGKTTTHSELACSSSSSEFSISSSESSS